MLKFLGSNKRLLVTLLLLAVIIVTALVLANVIHVFHRQKPTVPVSAGSTFSSKGEKKATSGSSSSSGNVPPITSQKTPSTTTNLLTPTGNFVSDHHPNLSGYPAPNTMSSVCNTTPGATCQIDFIQNGVTRSLPQQTTDSTGFTNWSWKLQDIGITNGTWKIEALATLNGQTKTAFDAMDLVVSQ